MCIATYQVPVQAPKPRILDVCVSVILSVPVLVPDPGILHRIHSVIIWPGFFTLALLGCRWLTRGFLSGSFCLTNTNPSSLKSSHRTARITCEIRGIGG